MNMPLPPIDREDRVSSGGLVAWRGKGLIRILLLLTAGAAIAAVAAAFSITRDYGFLQVSILTGSVGGNYYQLATRLAERAARGHGTVTVVPTAGSLENVDQLARGACAENFAFIQDGTPVPGAAGLELLGRLPEPESLFLLGRQDNIFHAFADLRGASIGIGPEGSGTAYLMRQLFEDPDLRQLDVHLSNHELVEQARVVAEGKLDLAALVMQENAELLRTMVKQYHLDIVAPRDIGGVIARYPELSLGTIPAARYDVAPPIPPVDKQITHLATLVIASSCAKRADRIALLTLLEQELPGFLRANPPGATNPATMAPLALEAHQFFRSGEADFSDRYFPRLVNIMSPAFWVYLVMAVTILFKAMTGYSRFRLWRLDASRTKLETALKDFVDPGLTYAQIRDAAEHTIMSTKQRADAKAILEELGNLRARCERQTGSLITPMGDEMYYRYQRSLIDEARTALATLLERCHSTPSKTISLAPDPEEPAEAIRKASPRSDGT